MSKEKNIKIGSRFVGEGFPPLIIAELSGNHNNSLKRALDLVDAAAEAGADAIKIQTYTADTMTLDIARGEFVISNPDSLWYGRTLHELYEKASLPWEWHQAIFARAAEKGILAFSTPFDSSAVEFLADLNVPCYKIASFELTDIELISKVATLGKPMLMSVGMASVDEIAEAVAMARKSGCEDIILLKCTSSYPAKPEQANLRTIRNLKETFQTHAGLSDHTMGIGVAIAGVALGAEVVEKHFTLARADGGVDAAFSLEPRELADLVAETRNAWAALGSVSYGPVGEMENYEKSNRRSLYIVRDIPAGEKLGEADIRAIRPGQGLPVKYRNLIIGRMLKEDVCRGTPTSWNLFI